MKPLPTICPFCDYDKLSFPSPLGLTRQKFYCNYCNNYVVVVFTDYVIKRECSFKDWDRFIKLKGKYKKDS